MSPTAREVRGPDPSRDRVNRQAGGGRQNQRLRAREVSVRNRVNKACPPPLTQAGAAPELQRAAHRWGRQTWASRKASTPENSTWAKQGVYHLEAHPVGAWPVALSDRPPRVQSRGWGGGTDRGAVLQLLGPCSLQHRGNWDLQGSLGASG